MKHKQLLALFLCLVIVLSSRICLIGGDKVVQVKVVSNNLDKYLIKNIKEESDGLKILIYYPETKVENVNKKIESKINEYINEIKQSKYSGQEKKLSISFEEFEYNEYTSFKFKVRSNAGVTHDTENVFTITYNDTDIVKLEEIFNEENIKDKVMKECKTRVKENEKLKMYSNEKWLEEGLNDMDNYNNYIVNENSIVITFNPCIIAPAVAGIIEIEIPYTSINEQ